MWIGRALLLEHDEDGNIQDQESNLSRASDAYRAALQVANHPEALLGLSVTARRSPYLAIVPIVTFLPTMLRHQNCFRPSVFLPHLHTLRKDYIFHLENRPFLLSGYLLHLSKNMETRFGVPRKLTTAENGTCETFRKRIPSEPYRRNSPVVQLTTSGIVPIGIAGNTIDTSLQRKIVVRGLRSAYVRHAVTQREGWKNDFELVLAHPIRCVTMALVCSPQQSHRVAECLVRLVMPTIGTLAAAGMELSRLSMVAKATNLSEMMTSLDKLGTSDSLSHSHLMDSLASAADRVSIPLAHVTRIETDHLLFISNVMRTAIAAIACATITVNEKTVNDGLADGSVCSFLINEVCRNTNDKAWSDAVTTVESLLIPEAAKTSSTVTRNDVFDKNEKRTACLLYFALYLDDDHKLSIGVLESLLSSSKESIRKNKIATKGNSGGAATRPKDRLKDVKDLPSLYDMPLLVRKNDTSFIGNLKAVSKLAGLKE
mmetsp:Transcript_12003/g.34317  ORF Transcript_12003/g.34317 Transcript_12003/m.34317 type:complete len:486 (-) Transcript_12003:33-1490(-)